jgi:hypothetical protein
VAIDPNRELGGGSGRSFAKRTRLEPTTETRKEDEGGSKGLSLCFADDHEMLKHGMIIYDALCAACSGTPLWKVVAWRV